MRRLPTSSRRALSGAAGQRPASERITTALIGSGGRGQQIIEGGGQVLAVCDVDTKHAQAAKAKIDAKAGNRDCKIYRDFREVLARDDIDAVVIATPDHWHTPMAIAAIEANKAVYIEKPMTLTIDEGRQLVDAVRRYGAILQVGSQQRSDEKFIRACECVRNGRVGELRTVRVDIPTRAGNNQPWAPESVPPELDYEAWLGPAPWAPYHRDRCHYNFRFVTDYSGGDVTNWGAHQLDIAQWGIGADAAGPVEVTGSGKRNTNGLHDTFYEVQVDFTYANGVKVHLGSSGNGVRFEGSQGWVYVSRSELKADPAAILASPIGPNEMRLAPPGPAKTHMGSGSTASVPTRPRTSTFPLTSATAPGPSAIWPISPWNSAARCGGTPKQKRSSTTIKPTDYDPAPAASSDNDWLSSHAKVVSGQWSVVSKGSYDISIAINNYQLRTTNYQLRTTNYQLRTTNYQLPTTN